MFLRDLRKAPSCVSWCLSSAFRPDGGFAKKVIGITCECSDVAEDECECSGMAEGDCSLEDDAPSAVLWSG